MQFCSQPRYENKVIHTSSTTGNIAVLWSLRCIFMRKTMDSFKKNGENILEEYMRQPYIWLEICIKEPFYAGCHSVCFSQIAQHSTISNHMTYIFKTHCTQGQPVFEIYRNESDFLLTSYQRWLYPGKSWRRENKFSFLEVTNQIQSLYHMSCGMTLDLIRRVFWLWYPLWFHWVSSAVPLASGLGPSMKPKMS